jgi:hypothetical protein
VVPHTEVPLDVPGGQWKVGTIFMGDDSGKVYVIDVSIVNTDSATTQRRRGDFGAVEAALSSICARPNKLSCILRHVSSRPCLNFGGGRR